jgi:outer membrane protein assembly factor BamB
MKFTAMVTMTVLLLAVAAASIGGDWPAYLGPDQTASSSETGLARSWPQEGPKILWKIDVGAGFAAPVVSGGEVFFLDRGGPDKKEQDILRCLNLADGQEKWRVAYNAPGTLSPAGSRSAAAVDEKYVFAVGSFGHLSCFDRQRRKLVWQKNLLAEFGGKLPGWGVAQSPVLYGRTVIVSPLGAKAGLAAFNKADGRQVWASKPLGKMEYVSPTLTKIAGVDQVLILSNAGKLVTSVRPADGKVLWSYTGWKCNIPITVPAHVGDGRVFMTGGYNAGSAMIQVTRTDNGTFAVKELYKTQACGAQIHRPVVHEKHLFVNSNANERADGMLCMDLAGNVKWKTQRDPNFERGGMLLADGLIFNLDGQTGILYLIEPDPRQFKVLASAKVLETKDAWAPLTLADGKLLLRDQKTLKCLDVKAR